jgi:hypothetical protein
LLAREVKGVRGDDLKKVRKGNENDNSKIEV